MAQQISALGGDIAKLVFHVVGMDRAVLESVQGIATMVKPAVGIRGANGR
jgi:hypothetical protein